MRKKLFLLERKIAQKADSKPAGAGPVVEVNGPLSPAEMKKQVEEALKDAKPEAEKATGTADALDSADDKQQDFGGVSAKLDGGSLTSFSYSSTGIDLSKAMPGYGVVLLLQSNEIDISGLEKDESMNDKFAGSNRDSFYGLKDYKDMVNMYGKKAPGKDYTMTGLGLNMALGAYSLGIVNFSRPPQRKKKVFFGGDSAGPYQIGATGVIPGSEKVRVAGSELARGTGYDINYNRGEITFYAPVAQNDKAVVEYELAVSGSGAPGKFTGFRFQTNADDEKKEGEGKKKAEELAADYTDVEDGADAADGAGAGATVKKEKFLEFKNWGVSFMKDQVLSYSSGGAELSRQLQDHTLTGFDGKAEIRRFGEISFETAQSSGDKEGALGRYASASFTIADTHASDLDPAGPYYLDETTLPILENSDEVRVNGIALERDKDYTLDATYGYLRIKKKDLDLGALDRIAVTYRYLTEEDRLNTASRNSSGAARKIGFKNEFGKLKHSFETSRFSPEYMQVGGATTNTLEDTKQSVSVTPLKGLDLKIDRGHTQSLKDAATNLKENADRQNISVDYKRGGRFSFSYKNGVDTRVDNLAAHVTDTERGTSDWSLDLAPAKDCKIGFKSSSSRNTTALQSGGVNEDRDIKNTLTFSAKPLKMLSFNTTQSTGKSQQNSNGQARDRAQKSADYAVKYQPFKTLKIDYSFNSNSFSSAADAPAAALAAPPAAATGAAFASDTAESAPTGNRGAKIALAFNPSKRIAVTVNRQKKNDDHAEGSRAATQDALDARYKFSDSASVQYRVSALDYARVNQSQKTGMESYILQLKTKLLKRGLNIDIKRDTQKSDITSSALAGGSETATTAGSDGTTFTFTAEPFWKGKNFRYERQSKSGTNTTNGAFTLEKEERRSIGFEVPFFGKSSLSFERNEDKRGGARETIHRDFGVTLGGKLTRLFDLQFSYKKQADIDRTDPEASNHSSDMNIVIKGEIEL